MSTTQPPAAGEAAHTPTPYYLADESNCCIGQQDIIDRLTEDLPNRERHFSAIGINDEDGYAETVAYAHPKNAAFIVRACNSHAALVAALEEAAACLLHAKDRTPGMHDTYQQAEQQARAALAAATAKA